MNFTEKESVCNPIKQLFSALNVLNSRKSLIDHRESTGRKQRLASDAVRELFMANISSQQRCDIRCGASIYGLSAVPIGGKKQIKAITITEMTVLLFPET